MIFMKQNGIAQTTSITHSRDSVQITIPLQEVVPQELVKKKLNGQAKNVAATFLKEIQQYKEEHTQLKQQNMFLKKRNQGLQALERRFHCTHAREQRDALVDALCTEVRRLQQVVSTHGQFLKESQTKGSVLTQLTPPVFEKSWNPFTYLARRARYSRKKAEYEQLVRTVRKATCHFVQGRDEDGVYLEHDGSKGYKHEHLCVSDSYVETHNKFIRIYYLADVPSFLGPNVMFKLINSPIPFRISSFVEPTSNAEILRIARQRISVLESQQNDRIKDGKMRDQKLDRSIDELGTFIEELVHETEKAFVYSMYVGIEAGSKEELIELDKQFQDLTNSMDIVFNTYTFGQKKAYKTLLPTVHDAVGHNRILQSTAVSYFMPFVSKQLNDPDGIFFGINIYNGNLVFVNPFTARNNNMNIFGVSGAGKSITSKVLATRMFMRGTQIIIIDPEGEYVDLARSLGGEVIAFSRSNGINPFYIGSDDEAHVLDHISTLKTFFSFFIPPDKYDGAILDERLMELYYKHSPDFKTFLVLMKDTPMYTYLNVLQKGSLKGVFNSTRELKLDNDFLVFNLKELSNDERRTPAMYLLTSLIWSLVNQGGDKRRMLFIDEAHELLKKEKAVAIFYQELVKKARKRNLGIVSITQDVEDFIGNEYGKAIVTNSETKMLLKQSHTTISLLKSIFPLTDEELHHLGGLQKGELILFRETEHIQLHVHRLPHEEQLIEFVSDKAV